MSKDILSRHPIPARNVVGHSDVAPNRKQDPGELFPWHELAQNGIGLWPDAQFNQTSLLDLGYEDEGADSILAFQRHFTPDHLNGVLDDRTKEALSRICLT
ncbi:N-acetylmuramoyl-L-alanine amidase [Terasakiella sp.]|uniref:N-acetylmuramoyl-L-alanine amidase n=1 Tax=Terasakiella sp. TaxID=2034861 RepID=UPI003B001C52